MFVHRQFCSFLWLLFKAFSSSRWMFSWSAICFVTALNCRKISVSEQFCWRVKRKRNHLPRKDTGISIPWYEGHIIKNIALDFRTFKIPGKIFAHFSGFLANCQDRSDFFQKKRSTRCPKKRSTCKNYIFRCVFLSTNYNKIMVAMILIICKLDSFSHRLQSTEEFETTFDLKIRRNL